MLQPVVEFHWVELNVRPKQSRESKTTANIHVRPSGDEWRRQNAIIEEYMKTGHYEPGSAFRKKPAKSFIVEEVERLDDLVKARLGK